MKIYSASQIGEYHINHCEDYLFVGDIGNDKLLCAVMDGCTMATDSYFISTLVGKLLRKIVKGRSYKELYQAAVLTDTENYLKSIVRELFSELKLVINQLMLDRNELLTTLLLLLIDKKTNQGMALVIGDGVVCINGQITEFDHDNKPDYLGFHLHEDFDAWYNNQQQKIVFDRVQDISIATDGIGMILPVKKVDAGSIDPVNFLLIDDTQHETDDMLNLKLKKLEHTFGLKPTDDLAIIRLIK